MHWARRLISDGRVAATCTGIASRRVFDTVRGLAPVVEQLADSVRRTAPTRQRRPR